MMSLLGQIRCLLVACLASPSSGVELVATATHERQIVVQMVADRITER